MEQDQVDRSEESMDEYDSEEEETPVRPGDYYDSDRSDYDNSDANSEEARDLAFSQRDYDELLAEYNFDFNGATGRGLPDLSELH